MAKKTITKKEMKPGVIISPLISEKAAHLTENNVYTFLVGRDATKHQIADSFEARFDKKPIRVTVSNIRPRVTFKKGREGHAVGYKKAMVFLKKGETIEFI